MNREGLILWGVLLFLIFVGAASSWTPTSDINLRCVYEEFNVTNMSICGNLTMGDTCAEGCFIRFMIIPNQSGYIYFWSSGLPFYFNNNVTINGTMIINNTVQLNVSGNINMNKNNITEVSSIFIDDIYNNSGGGEIRVFSDILMEYPYNITANYFIGNASHGLNEVECWGNATHPCHWCEYFNGTHKVEESPCTV